jgi:hypothetical protein
MLVAALRVLCLGAFMIDTRLDLGAVPGDAFYRSHSCLTAYWCGETLARSRVSNIYDDKLYEGRQIDGFDVDPYRYPPPFLLLPRAAKLVIDDFATLRASWFIVELGLFVYAYGALAAWIGGRRGAHIILLMPVVVTGLPVLMGLQMGNFHLAAIALAVLGMLAVERDRGAWAGFCLAVSSVAKFFPAILLVFLLTRRKYQPVLWAAGWLILLCLASVALFGLAPFHAFVEIQLPELFGPDLEAWEAARLYGTVNSSIFGLALKLRAIGLPFEPFAASVVGWFFGAAVCVGAVRAGAARRHADEVRSATPAACRNDAYRLREAQLWLAFLALASLGARFTPDAYAGSPALWLLALVAVDPRRPKPAIVVAAFLLLWVVLPSRLALPGIEGPRLMFSLGAALVFLTLAGTVGWRCHRSHASTGPTSKRTIGARVA